MVGIDPNTGLVQSIHMPPAGADSGKDQPVISTEQISPLAQSQVVQTVVQSLHIQNNVLVQGVTPSGVPSAFLQPLSAMGNALIPVFQSPVAVGGNCDDGALSMMSMTPASNSVEVQSTYAETRKKSCQVVSTQTEAVQTEDSCSDLMDPEGGGRLLVEYEDSILADDSYVLENDEAESSTVIYANHSSVGESSETTSLEPNVVGCSPEAPKSFESSSPIVEAQPTMTISCKSIIKDSVCTADGQAAASSGQLECQSSASEANSHSMHTSESSGHPANKTIHRRHLQTRKLIGNTDGCCVVESASSEVADEVLLCAHSDSLSSLPVQQPANADGAVQTDSASESVTMPILSRESSVASDGLQVSDQEEGRINSAMEQIYTRLEDAVRRCLEQNVERSDVAVDLCQPPMKQNDENLAGEVAKQDADIQALVDTQKEERFGDPPNLPVMTRLGKASKKRTFFQKNKCGRYKKKARKVVRNGLCGFVKAGLRQQRIAACKDSADVTRPDIAGKEPIPLNNNKSTDTLPEPPPDVTDNIPDKVKEPDAGNSEKENVKVSTNKVPPKPNKMSTSSSSGSSDGEANQSSDSSQSMATSEGDEVRCGNSPAIRCSNLLTSSPETGDMNCGGLADFEKLETIYAKNSTNHITATNRQIKTRRSLRSQLDNMLPNHGVKRAFCDRKVEEDNAGDSSGSASPDPGYVRTLSPGELIWGPVKTYPSWPGKLVSYNDVPKNPKSEDGKLWVHWFGFHTYSQVEPQELKTLTEGLEAHHSARQKHRKGRKLNSSLEAAIQEAMLELDRQMEQDNQSAIATDISMDTKVNKASNKRKRLR